MAENFNGMAQDLKSAEAVHSDSIRSVFHEFRTPRSVIKGGYLKVLSGGPLPLGGRQRAGPAPAAPDCGIPRRFSGFDLVGFQDKKDTHPATFSLVQCKQRDITDGSA